MNNTRLHTCKHHYADMTSSTGHTHTPPTNTHARKYARTHAQIQGAGTLGENNEGKQVPVGRLLLKRRRANTHMNLMKVLIGTKVLIRMHKGMLYTTSCPSLSLSLPLPTSPSFVWFSPRCLPAPIGVDDPGA